MPGNPKECHEQALVCMALAKEAHTQAAQRLFHELAESWFRLAVELEDAQNLLAVLAEMEVETFEVALYSDEDGPVAVEARVKA